METWRARIRVRHAAMEDLDSIVEFNQAMALETEGRRLNDDVIRAGARRVLEDPGCGFYRIAEVDSVTCGQLMVTAEWSDWRNAWFWWIQSVFVDSSYRRMGVYASLYETILEEAAEAGNVCGIRLYVERDNRDAQKVYRTLGMSPSDYLLFETEFATEDR